MVLVGMMVSVADCYNVGKHARGMGESYCDEFRTGSHEMALLVAKMAHEEALMADTFANKALFVPKTTFEVVWYAIRLAILITLTVLRAVFGALLGLCQSYISLGESEGDGEDYDDEVPVSAEAENETRDEDNEGTEVLDTQDHSETTALDSHLEQ